MSKWNVQTTKGMVAAEDIVAPRATPGFQAGYQQNSFQGGIPPISNEFGGGLAQTNQRDYGSFFGSRKGKICIASICCSIIVFGVLLGVLYPRYPIVDVNRNAALHTLQIVNNNSIVGYLPMSFYNPNLYPIDLKQFDFTGTLGQTGNTLTFTSSLGATYFPAQNTVQSSCPVNTTIPATLDLTAFATYISHQCIANVDKVSILVEGNVQINALGSVISFHFGPSNMFAPCL